MSAIKDKTMSSALKKAIQYIEKNPEKNITQIISWLEKFDKSGMLKQQLATVKNVLLDSDNNWTKFINSLYTDIDSDVRVKLFENFIINSAVIGLKKRDEAMEKYQCNVPWAILLDPTSACNLKCIGCWASEYGNKLNLTYEEIDDIINQGKELGVYMYIYTGGEPMVRKNDLIKLCQKHNDCVFLCFTNATLIDEAFIEQMLMVKNFVPAISIEGNEYTTDLRRGKGTYQKVIKAMRLLKENKLPFGVSCCYTSQNVDVLSSEEFIDSLINFGAKFSWFFHYMPVGNDAVTDLLCTPSQREKMYHQIRKFRNEKSLFTIDFQNDGEYVGGCIAGGRNYLHINPHGDIEPCVFIHYSDSNIREKTLLEALQSPLFKAYRDGQPFNKNHLMPCPMLENPERLKEIVHQTGAKSTDLQSYESVDHLCDKCTPYAKNWQSTANRLWQEYHQDNK